MATPLKRPADTPPSSDPSSSKKTKNSAITSFFSNPNPSSAKGSTTSKTSSSSSTSLSASGQKFNKQKWVESLTAEQRGLLNLEIETLDESWLAYLKDVLVTREFLGLKGFLKKEVESGKTVYPKAEEIYSWSRHTPLHTVRCVVLGQDPYHNVNQAHGLCFSVRPPVPAPPSLKNIYTALRNDYPDFKAPPRNHGLLTPWAESGVLLLNTCLTVRAHEANSHSGKGWENFTQKVIDTVAKVRGRGVVFLAWGSPAQKRCAGIEKSGKHLVLKSVHPSPLSAHKPPGFFNTGHFKKTNEWLRERYGKEGEINWNLDVEKPIKEAKNVKIVESGEEILKKTGKTVGKEEAHPAHMPKPFGQKAAAVEEAHPAHRPKPFGQKKNEAVAEIKQNGGGVSFSEDDEDEEAIEAMNELASIEAASSPVRAMENKEENGGNEEVVEREDDNKMNMEEEKVVEKVGLPNGEGEVVAMTQSSTVQGEEEEEEKENRGA
ncbi:MAG: hypothetical protein Q9227_002104 [Pyrenula ochraceoflavens]